MPLSVHFPPARPQKLNPPPIKMVILFYALNWVGLVNAKQDKLNCYKDMDQKTMSSNDLLVKPSRESQNGVYNPPKPRPGSRPIETNENDQERKQGLNKGNHTFTFMSKEELKIRNELEKDIERDLEEEIKDEIYRMALKLHRLYAGRIASKNQQERLSHLNISIRLDGGTKIEIKETKKKAANNNPRSSKSNNPQSMPVIAKKFDWEKSLRSGKYNPVIINKRSERSSRVKTPSNDRMSIKGV